MYCTNCGAKNRDQAKFCTQCGQSLADPSPAEMKSKPLKKKSRNWYMVSISLVLVVTIVIVSVFDLWPWSARTVDSGTKVARTEKESEEVQAEQKNDVPPEGQTTTDTDIVTLETFSLDAIVEQCPDCQAAIETYIATIAACQDWTTSKETIEALENQKCAQMQHFCTAPAIYVEDIPYAYHGSYGLYTGDWIGAGPAGNGTYTGTVYDIDMVSYTGGWGFGMPDGEGKLYLQNYLGPWDMTYTGEMKNGMRDGVGSWFEYYDDGGYHEPVFRIYDDAVYSQDQLTEWTTCVEYDAVSGDILQYCKMKTNEDGLPMQGEIWNPGDLSPEQENALGIAGSLFIVGVTAYMAGEMVQSLTDPHYADSIYQGKTPEEQLAELNRYNEQKAAEEKERLEKEQEKKKSDKAWAGGMLDGLDAGETPWYENNRSYYEAIYYGN